ncbi:unnamed protein product [Chondrus crispus]|uniref:Uncharacterized protein n=1 Tax=Chondrus crispus TaxID=2769 RepID=R7QH48_CHOCR|nr:unnamed protein product [Chondrus crispus]CDF37063.1 unnamed protein product [Chondrus crispus]|eukprot:XP_005716882.1 unnamed protein product [Chondrus crispus]
MREPSLSPLPTLPTPSIAPRHYPRCRAARASRTGLPGSLGGGRGKRAPCRFLVASVGAVHTSAYVFILTCEIVPPPPPPLYVMYCLISHSIALCLGSRRPS